MFECEKNQALWEYFGEFTTLVCELKTEKCVHDWWWNISPVIVGTLHTFRFENVENCSCEVLAVVGEPIIIVYSPVTTVLDLRQQPS